MSKPNVSYEMLDASAAHLSQQTRQLLENDEIEGVLFYPKGPWGWFVHVPDLDAGESVGEQAPEDLKACVEFARVNGFHWIMFDVDGTLNEGLPVYEEITSEMDKASATSTNVDNASRQLAQSYARHLSRTLGKNISGTLDGDGKIRVSDDAAGGIDCKVSQDFALAMVVTELPVHEQ